MSQWVIWLRGRMTIIHPWSQCRAFGQVLNDGIVLAHSMALITMLRKWKSQFSDLLSRYLDEFSLIPPYATLQKVGFGPGYTAVDALTLYMMVRHLKPRRYIEVGSGISTYYCSVAAERNAKECHPLEITCIEPHPYDQLRTIPGIKVLAKEVQDAELSLFQQLQENDILFIDSSHILRIDGDVPFLYLEVLPTLNSGVVI